MRGTSDCQVLRKWAPGGEGQVGVCEAVVVMVVVISLSGVCGGAEVWSCCSG